MWLTPYRGVRYHLREIKTAAKKPEDKYELFNYRHSSLRNVVERTFGVFKRRWGVYDRAPEFPFTTQIKLVYVLAAIHNHITIDADTDRDDNFDRLAPARNETRELHQSEHELEEEVSVKHEVSMSEQREVIAGRMWATYRAYHCSSSC